MQETPDPMTKLVWGNAALISPATAKAKGLEDGDMVEPVVAFFGDGVLNCLKNQKAMNAYGVTSIEGHLKNSLLLDLKVLICKEDVERLGLTEDSLVMDAEEIGGETKASIVPFTEIMKEMETSDHLLFF